LLIFEIIISTTYKTDCITINTIGFLNFNLIKKKSIQI
jgi:hypothetical protein